MYSIACSSFGCFLCSNKLNMVWNKSNICALALCKLTHWYVSSAFLTTIIITATATAAAASCRNQWDSGGDWGKSVMLKIWSTAVTHGAATQVLLTDPGVWARLLGEQAPISGSLTLTLLPFLVGWPKVTPFWLSDDLPTSSLQHSLSASRTCSSSPSSSSRWRRSHPVLPLSPCRNTICKPLSRLHHSLHCNILPLCPSYLCHPFGQPLPSPVSLVYRPTLHPPNTQLLTQF